MAADRTIRRAAFTAIEMTAVLALAALSATVTVLSLSGMQNRSTAREAADHLAWCDELSRATALRMHRSVRLVVSADHESIGQADAATAADGSSPEHVVYRLPSGCAIRRIVLRGGEPADAQTDILISASGLSASYALELIAGGKANWLIVSGLSGQMSRADNEQQVFETLGEMSRPGDDAR